MNSAIDKKFITNSEITQSVTPSQPQGSKHRQHHSSRKHHWKVKVALKVIGWIAFATWYIKLFHSVVREIEDWENSPAGKEFYKEIKKR